MNEFEIRMWMLVIGLLALLPISYQAGKETVRRSMLRTAIRNGQAGGKVLRFRSGRRKQNEL